MSFVSFEFPFFFVAVLLGLRLLPGRTPRQLFLLAASCLFYAAGTPWHLLVLAVPAVVDYLVAIRMEDSPSEAARRRWLLVSLVSNLGLLVYFKYADFFVDSIAALAGVRTASLGVALPIGISFFTFKALSYTIDVYRREIRATRTPWRFALFISFFPELVAGPIVRASIFLPQLERRLDPSLARLGTGLQVMLLGFTKKLLIANRLAVFVDPVFADPSLYSAGTLLAAVVAYSLQIYCDFSGYSDIAIGVAYIIGFDLPENFDMPYASFSIADFWRRWHMTLSRWLRDYVYIPLGGNRRGELRTYANLLLTMLLGGLWHGASWTFVIWGGLHGAGLAVHRLFQRWRPDARPTVITRAVSWAATYAFVCFCWVFFRATSLSSALSILRRIFTWDTAGIAWAPLPLAILASVVIAGHLVGLRIRRAGATDWIARPADWSGVYLAAPRPGFVAGFVAAAWLLILVLFSPMQSSPFIYFRF